MTRVVIFGDLHANLEALLALQQAETKPDVILCLGDIVGYGPDPKRCLDLVRTGATHVLGGWHDLAVGTIHRYRGNDLLEATWAHTRSQLPQADLDYLAALPPNLSIDVGGVRFHLTRLAPDDTAVETQTLITMSQNELWKRFDEVEADFILLGGPHIPAMRQIDEKLIVCPGSLGQPRYGVSDPTFAAWQDGRVQIHHLHYQPQDTMRKLALLPLDPEYVLLLQSTLQTGGLK